MKLFWTTLFSFSTYIVGAQVSSVSSEISIKREQIILLTPGENTIMGMFDKDSLTDWFPGWGGVYPAQALTDLKANYTITKVRLKNHVGSRKFIIYGGNDPFALTPLVNVSLTQFESWTEITLNKTVRFLQFEIPELKSASPVTLKIFGYMSSPISNDIYANTNLSRSTPVIQPNVNGIFGVNTFHWVDIKKETAFIGLREYVDVEWIENQDGKYRFNPTGGGNGWLDNHYAALKNSGFEVLPCIKGTMPWTRTPEYSDPEFKPVYPLNANPGLPASYLKSAQFHFQFAARYGSTKVDPSLLEIDGTPRWTNDSLNVKKSGLNYVKYFECWNEPDKNWKGRDGFFTPYEFAAFMSAVADGHCGTLGAKAGIKAADPNAKIVMGGLANINLDYVKAMNLWFVTYRPDHSIPVDVYNFHHYSNSGGSQHVAGSFGISPEQDKLKELLREVKTYVDAYAPGKEIFFSEYGYDSNTGSIQRSPVVGSMGITEVQGIWNVRSMLEIMAAGIDKSYSYLMYDESNSQYDVFSNCGMLTTEATGHQKKPAWYYLNTLKETLKGYKFAGDMSTDNNIRKYKFTKNNTDIYAIWLTSSTDAKAKIILDLPGINSATVISLADKSDLGIKNTMAVSGALKVDISERPIFITSTTPVIAELPLDLPPVVSAGADITSAFAPNNTVVITGTATDKESAVVSHAWTQISGPAALLSGNTTTKLSIVNPAVGTYVIKFSATDKIGQSTSDEVKLVVTPAIAFSGPTITKLVLADADKDVELATLTPNYTLDLAKYACTFTFLAKTTTDVVKSIAFFWDGVLFKTVKGAPFSFTDNCYPGFICYNGWWKPKTGQHTLTAIPYSGLNATGTKGQTYTIALSVINSSASNSRSQANDEYELSAEINLVPNPAKDEVTINLGTANSESNVTIMDAVGRVYCHHERIGTSQLKVSLNEMVMPAGVYLVKVSSPTMSLPKILRFIKE